MKIRSFLAFDLQNDFKQKLFQRFQEIHSQYPDSGRIEKAGKLHITVKFFGDSEPSRLKVLSEMLREGLRLPELEVEVDKYGFFGRESDRIVLLAHARLNPEPSKFFHSLNKILQSAGFPETGKDFKPHITLMRAKRKLPDGFLDKFLSSDVRNLRSRIRSFVLYESKLLRTGSVYHPLLEII